MPKIDDGRGKLTDLDLLHAITMDSIGEQALRTLYNRIVDAAVSITGSQFGTMQALRQPEDGTERWKLPSVSFGSEC